MDVTRLEHEMSKFTHGEPGGIRRLPHRWQRTVDAMGDYFESLLSRPTYEYGIF